VQYNKIIYFSINEFFNINIIKQISNKLDKYYYGMSYLNINYKYIITFGGDIGHLNNIYILEIKTNKFYKCKIKLKDKFYRSGCFLENNKLIHIFGGIYTNNHYTIYLRNIIGLNLNEINILINYFLKINNIKNLKWVKDLNKIIKNFI